MVNTYFPSAIALSQHLEKVKMRLIKALPLSLPIQVVEGGSFYHCVVNNPDGSADIYKLDKGTGWWRNPEYLAHFTSEDVARLKRIPKCRRITGVGNYCGVCPSCLRGRSMRKVFTDLEAEERRIARELQDLNKLKTCPQVHLWCAKRELEKASKGTYQNKITRLKRRYEWLKSRQNDVDGAIREKEAELAVVGARNSKWKCKDKVKLFRAWHYFVTVSLPLPLHVLFEVRDEWFGQIRLDGYRADSDVRAVLGLLQGKVLDCGVIEVFRDLLKKLLIQEYAKIFQPVELAAVHQVHSHGTQHDVPDIHTLICEWGMQDGKPVRIMMNRKELRASVSRVLTRLAKVVDYAAGHWADGNRSTEFLSWRKMLKTQIEQFDSEELPDCVVDVRRVSPRDLLTVQRYMRRLPMERVKTASYKQDKGDVLVGWWKQGEVKHIPTSVIQFLKWLAGADGRLGSLRVAYQGLYTLEGAARRTEAFRAVCEGITEHAQDSIRSMKQAWRKS